MPSINSLPASGTRDLLSGDVMFREANFSKIKRVFENFGFFPIDTPAFERIETLVEKYGDEGEKLIFKILQRGEQAQSGEADLALRYDLTVPLARVIAEYRNQLPSIFKRYQIGPVWRADRPGKGRYREFYQCDIDIVGVSSLMADVEIILALSEALVSLGLPSFTILLNSRKVISGLLEVYKVPQVLRSKVITILDKLDKIGIPGVCTQLEKIGLPLKSLDLIKLDLKENKHASIIRARLEDSQLGSVGLSEVDEIMRLVKPNLTPANIVFSPFLARGLDYYTGPIFEIIHHQNSKGSIAAGGRYDDLIEAFSGEPTPVCGGSLGIERIFLILQEKGIQLPKSPTVNVLVALWNKDFCQDTLQIAAELRRNNLSTEVYLKDNSKIGDQIRYASKRNIPYLVLLGPDEKQRGEVTVKNLKSGAQRSVLLSDLVSVINQENSD